MGAAFDNAESRLNGRERHVVGHYRLGEALQVKLTNLFHRHCIFDRDGDRLSEKDLSILGLSAQPRGEIANSAMAV